ncbi:MAG TPA: hypothetical protein PLV01_00920 [Candidatus Kapabacteria bacterium]|nr:hypothetical protein [Candidatus Kapabacteria bacterium]HPU23861.1 hypothetical protein [Candidatus Kapabacteria bacterium]
MAVRKIKYYKRRFTDNDFFKSDLSANKYFEQSHLSSLNRKVSLLPFKIGNINFVANSKFVEIVIPSREKYTNQNFPKWISGLIAYEETILPVVDLPQLGNFRSSGEPFCTIIFSDGAFRFGIEADFVRFPFAHNAFSSIDASLFSTLKIQQRDYYFLNIEMIFELIRELEFE